MFKKTTKKIEALIRPFIAEIKKDIPVKKVYLYGSYANGTYTKHSDIDIVVVSSAFNKGTYISNMQYLFKKAARINSLIEPIPASPAEIRKKTPFLKAALKQSIEIS